jgi:hypothetical protein
MADYPLNKKKRHLLLLNRILRQELKVHLFTTPSKLDEAQVNKLFDATFKKKDDYYVPNTMNTKLLLHEDLFKNLYKRKVKKSEPKKTEENIKHKIIKGYYYYIIDKNYNEGDKLYKNINTFKFDVADNIKDITNDNILNWFNSKNEYDKFKKDNTEETYITKYFEDLERIQDKSKELRNKLKNINIITVDVNDIHKFTGRKRTYTSNLYDIKFGKLDINKGFRKEEEKELKTVYESDRNVFKNLPDEKQIYSLLKKRNIKFDYFVYIYNSTYSTTDIIPTKYTDGEGYEKGKEYLYDKNGKLVKIIRDSKTTANSYSILQYFTKPEPKKPEPKPTPEDDKPEEPDEPEEPDSDYQKNIKNKDKIIELNKKMLDEVDKIINIKSPWTFGKYKDKNENNSYFIKLLKEYNLYKPQYDEFLKKLPKDLNDKSQTDDFYPTPIACIKPFENPIKYASNILEPTAGVGHIVNRIREINKTAKITAIEITNEFYEILKIFNPDVEVMKRDFLWYNPDIVDYDMIVINPPFTNRGDSRFYMNFLFHCLYLINRTKEVYIPSISFISPPINDRDVKNEGFFLNNILKSKMLSLKKLEEICKRYGLNPTKKQLEYLINEDDKIFKKDSDLDEAYHFKHQFEDLFDFYQGNLLDSCKGFGGTSTSAKLYQITGYKRDRTCKKVEFKVSYRD